MISALLFLQYNSFRNRLRQRLLRLKKPKYLVGAVVGALYFWFWFGRYWFLPGDHGGSINGRTSILPESAGLAESIAAAVLLLIVLLSWVLPKSRAALAFSEAEIAFLFPAPITRRGLIHYKLVRSQTAILFSTLFLTLFSGRWRMGGGVVWITILGWWIILSTLSLHLLAISFTRTKLLDLGITDWQRRLTVFGVIILAISGIAFWAYKTLPPPRAEDLIDIDRISSYCQQLLVAGPLPYLLYPFRLVARPFLSKESLHFLEALGPALAIMALNYWWVVRANIAFEEASVELSQKLAERIAAMRRDPWQARSKPRKPKRPPFRLNPNGPPGVALLWKNLIAAGQLATVRMWILITVITLIPITILAMKEQGAPGMILGALAAGMLTMSFLVGPQAVRVDFRQDLEVIDILKAYPMRGWQVMLGELLAPITILTAIQWILVLIAVSFLGMPNEPRFSWPVRIAFGLGIAMLAPAFDLISLIIPNAATLLFPGWVRPGRDGARGIEATGQMIIALFAQLIVFVLALLPAAIAFLLGFFPAKLIVGWIAAVPLAAIPAAIVLLAEGAVAIFFLGKLFERMDVAAELSP